MSYKIANFADIHARGKDLDVFEKALEEAFLICADEGVAVYTFAGDTIDRANVNDPKASTGRIIRAFSRALGILPDWPAKLFLVGDHDRADAASEDGLRFLDAFEDIEVIREPKVLRPFIQQRHRVGPVIFALPWSWNPTADPERILGAMLEDYERSFDLTSGPRFHMLLAHCEVVGMSLSRFKRKEATKDARSFCFSREYLQGLGGKIDFAALGNYHKRQALGAPVGSQIVSVAGGFVGALRQLHYGEEGNPQGFEIVTVHDDGSHTVRWIELESPPQYVTKTVTEKGAVNVADQLNDGDKVRVRFDLGEVPDPVLVRQLEDAGAEVEAIVPEIVRESRATEIEEGILGKRPEMVRLWAGMQDPPLSEDEVAELLRIAGEEFGDIGLRAKLPESITKGDVAEAFFGKIDFTGCEDDPFVQDVQQTLEGHRSRKEPKE